MNTIKLSQNKIGKKIKNIRVEREMSLNSFALILNVSLNTVIKWEKAKNLPSLMNLVKLCNTFDIKIDEFVLFED